MWPQRRQPTRLPCPWDSPGKNTVVGCHFLLQCMKVKSESEVAQSCLTLRDPMDCSPPGSSVHRIFQARLLEWGAIAFSVLVFLDGAYLAKTISHVIQKFCFRDHLWRWQAINPLFAICLLFPGSSAISGGELLHGLELAICPGRPRRGAKGKDLLDQEKRAIFLKTKI